MRKRPDRAYIFLHDSKAGLPERHPGGYRFRYDPDYLQQPDALPVSLTLPLSDKVYESKELFLFSPDFFPKAGIWILYPEP